MIIVLSITFLFCAVLGRVLYLVVFQGENLQARAAEQWLRDLPLSPPRGEILDRNGVILAGTETSYTVYVRPRSVTDTESVCDLLFQELGVDKTELAKKIDSSAPVSEITVKKGVSREIMLNVINAENCDGIYFAEESKRYYPYCDFMTQILGFTNYDGNGQEGIEKYYDNYLFGTKGYVMTESDLVGRELKNGGTYYVPSVSGANLTLAIDYDVQSFAESVVKDGIKTYSAKSASCLVLDAKTGEVLAMANAPSFDLNSPPRKDVAELFSASKNKLITDVFEPGSTFKIITLAAALEEGVVNENSTFYCNGSKIVDGKRIKCWKSQGHGSQTLAEAVKNSCNCAFMEMALRLGTERFYDYISAFGLTEKTGIDAFGEVKALTIPESSVKNVDLARIGFGQAIAVTPIGLVRAVAAAVNGGNLLHPYIAKSCEDSMNNCITLNGTQVIRQVVSKETSQKVAKMLWGVVSEGSGKKANVAGYKIGGKTGTAQKYKNGTIARGAYISSFIGVAPIDDPKYIVFVMVDEPQGYAYYGSLVAAPYAGEIFSNIFAKFNVRQDPSLVDGKSGIMPNVTGISYSEACGTLKASGIEYEVVGETGRIVRQIPEGGAETDCNTVALLITENYDG